MIRAALILAVAVTAEASVVQRTVTPGAAGPNRLDLDVNVLANAAIARYDVSTAAGKRAFTFTGGLEDIRLRDADGTEHPYLLLAPPARKAEWKSAVILPVAATKTTSGFEADFGAAAVIDRVRLQGIAAPFLKRVRVEGSGDRERWALLSDATVFDLPDERLRNVEVAFRPGSFRYVRVTWDDRSSARVRSLDGAAARLYDAAAAQPQQRIPVGFRSIGDEPRRSRYRIALPGAHLPIAAIELQVDNPNVFREAAVTEQRLSGSTVEPVVLGAGSLRRAARGDAVAEDLSVPISFPEGPDLELAVDDGSNPPLTITAVTAVLAPLPWIYFESADGKPVLATYGGRTAQTPPRYDLEASRATAKTASTAIASWAPEVEAAVAPAARPAELVATGAPIERRSFQYARSIGPTTPGLTSLLLDADVLAHTRGLTDLRIVRPDDRQIPYLVERRDAPISVPLRIPQRARGEGTKSLYRFTLPYDALPDGTRLVVTTDARVFDRTATLWRSPERERGRDREQIAVEAWRSADPETLPPPLTFTAALRGSNAVDLELDEGDNAPLPIVSAELLLPSYALRFISPGGPLTLVYGNSGSTAPRYDLAILGPRLFGEPAREISLARAAPMIATGSAATERRVFWFVIAAAVVALLLTLGRLLSGGGVTTGS